MNHAKFQGTHYEIGYRWGFSMAKYGNFILGNIPYPLTGKRTRFAKECRAVYLEFFPEILEEIRGIADGQKIPKETLETFLFSMYAMPPSCRCSCFAASNKNGIFFGRNSDFFTEMEEKNLNVIYQFDSDSLSFMGNTTAFAEMEDGVNARGLAVGMASVYPHAIRPGINAGMLVRLFLEKCASTKEVISLAQKVPIASAQTITIADARGDLAVIECDSGQTVVIPPKDAPFVCAANTFHSPAFSQSPSFAGNCNAGIDDWMSETRYQTMRSYLKTNADKMGISDAQGLLSGKEGFLCQYDRKTGKDTVWSALYELKNGNIYRSEGNPGRNGFTQDTRFHFLIK